MSERKRGTAAAIDIDALLQDTWLQVISLRHGPTFQAGEGRTLWERCIADVERVQRELKASELDEASCQHILTAQCALLDEAVKGRGVEDDACVQWYDIPLQGHFLGTMDAGDTLCDRMRDVLREPAPDHAVVTCFQRVMMLGFLGSYRSLNDPERQKLVNALSEYVTPFSYPQSHPVLAESHTGRGIMGGWLASWPVRIGLSVIVVAALWWGLDRWLDQLLLTLLSGFNGAPLFLFPLLFVLAFIFSVPRYLAMVTSRVPVWPESIESLCRIDKDDPYRVDASGNPEHPWRSLFMKSSANNRE